MDLSKILVILFSVCGSCFAQYNYDTPTYVPPPVVTYLPGGDPTPDTCKGKTVNVPVTSTVPVTKTEHLPRITNTIVIEPATSFLTMPLITETFVVTEMENMGPVTSTITHSPQPIPLPYPQFTITSPIPVYTTVTVTPFTETSIQEVTITKTMMQITSTVTKMSTVGQAPVITVKIPDVNINNTTLPAATISSTILITFTKDLMPDTRTVSICEPSTTTVPPVTSYHPAITISVSQTTITSTIPIIHTTVIGPIIKYRDVNITKHVERDCGRETGYSNKKPKVPFVHGSRPDDIDLELPTSK